MTKSEGNFTPLCKIKYKNSDKKSLIFLHSHKEEVLECLYKRDVFINDFLDQNSLFISQTEVMKIPFVRVKVEFNDDFAVISSLSKMIQ